MELTEEEDMSRDSQKARVAYGEKTALFTRVDSKPSLPKTTKLSATQSVCCSCEYGVSLLTGIVLGKAKLNSYKKRILSSIDPSVGS